MQTSILSGPVGAFMRPTTHVFIEDSLGVAALRLRDNGTSLIPVLNGNRLAGVVSEAGIARAMGEGAHQNGPLADAMEPSPRCSPYTTGAEALRLFDSLGKDTLVVTDDDGRVVGLLLPSDLLYRRQMPVRPPMVGGMATPFGVYLTTGAVGGGVSRWALVTTGMSMAAMLLVGAIAAALVSDFAAVHGLSKIASENLNGLLAIALFVLQMRLLPLSGIHAAEHKVVHAIERGEELTRETVRRMPRVHPRCGTNIAVGLSIFTGLASSDVLGRTDPEFKVIIAALVTWGMWYPAGSFVQYWITTKRPSDKQLDMGILAGKEILEKYQSSRVTGSTFLKRLWSSGLFHVVAGASIFTLLAHALLTLSGHGDLMPLK